jgi:hypothetical protein
MKTGYINRGILAAVCVCGWAVSSASADTVTRMDEKAISKLKEMSAYVAGLKSFRFQTDETVDAAAEFHGKNVKIQYSTCRMISVRRPGKMLIDVKGDLADRRMSLVSGNLTIYDRQREEWSVLGTLASPEDTVEAMRDQMGMIMPMGALIYRDLSEHIQKNADFALYLGKHKVRGQSAHHVLFRGAGYTWQLWISDGERPLPVKFVVTVTSEPTEPQYVVWIRDWESKVRLKDSVFELDVPESVKKVDTLPLLFWVPAEEE